MYGFHWTDRADSLWFPKSLSRKSSGSKQHQDCTCANRTSAARAVPYRHGSNADSYLDCASHVHFYTYAQPHLYTDACSLLHQYRYSPNTDL